MRFIPINLEKHREIVIPYRQDSFIASFGSDEAFGKEADYIKWLEGKVVQFPDGFVLAEEHGEFIGQLELSIREYNGKRVGYVHLYYLVPSARGKGIGSKLHHYAMDFFKKHNVDEYHLRVSPTNEQARTFYKKHGMKEIGPEVDGKVIRMAGKVEKSKR